MLMPKTRDESTIHDEALNATVVASGTSIFQNTYVASGHRATQEWVPGCVWFQTFDRWVVVDRDPLKTASDEFVEIQNSERQSGDKTAFGDQ